MPRFAEATDEDEDEDEEDGGSSGGSGGSTSSADSDEEAAEAQFPLQRIMGQAGVHKDGTRASLDAARIGIKTGEEAGKETEVRPPGATPGAPWGGNERVATRAASWACNEQAASPPCSQSLKLCSSLLSGPHPSPLTPRPGHRPRPRAS